jgi:hypothetical protein
MAIHNRLAVKLGQAVLGLSCIILPIVLCAKNDSNRPVLKKYSRAQILTLLFAGFNEKRNAVTVEGQEEKIISCEMRRWDHRPGSLVVLVVSSADRQARFYSYTETPPKKTVVGAWGVYLLQELDGSLRCTAMSRSELTLSLWDQAGGDRVHGLHLDLAPYFVREDECLIGMRIKSTYNVRYHESLILYQAAGGRLRAVFNETIAFSDRWRNYKSFLSISQEKSNGYFNLLMKTKSLPFLDGDREVEHFLPEVQCYVWNPGSGHYYQKRRRPGQP